MKKFKETMEEIKSMSAELEKVKSEQTATVNKYAAEKTLENFRKLREIGGVKLAELQEEEKNLTLSVKILKSNAVTALYNETMPVVLETLNNHAGKAYGPKTREKIRAEIKEKTDCAFWIESFYSSDCIHISPAGVFGRDYDIAAGTINGRILEGNKITRLELENVNCWQKLDYIEDIPGRVREIKEARKAASEAFEKLKAACDVYNVLTVAGIDKLRPEM